VILREFLIATKLALISNRTLILPDSVFRNGEFQFPVARAISIAHIDIANIPYVEPNFLYNRQTKHNISQPIPIIRNFSFVSTEKIGNLLERLIHDLDSTLKETEVVVLDFAQFNTWNDVLNSNFDAWWRNLMIIDDSGHTNLNSIRLCRNIADHQIYCLNICQ
jgi:hypothetical protein